MSYIDFEPVPLRPVFRSRKMAKGTVKNLFTDFTEEVASEDAIRVFLRLKPKSNEDKESIMEVIDSKTLLFCTPLEFLPNRKKLNIPDQYKFSFTKIFEANITQREIFNGCVAQHVKDLFAGQHCLLFTYGTTNAGKTYTILGNGQQPGIIPRTLTTIFKSIATRMYKNARIMPDMFNSVLDVTDKTYEEEMNFKEKILTWNPEKSQDLGRSKCQTTNSKRSSIDELLDEPVIRQMQSRLTGDTIEIQFDSTPEDRFSVWVSFAEIYNEAVYDLLQPIAPNFRRQQLKVARDRNKNCYIKGLKHVFVVSEEDAYKVLRFGKANLQVAATGINSSSSRSHCIFSIKLLRCPNVEHPERVVVSSFTICDLAGAERQKKTHNDGLRLKESQNINSSLMVLSKCFSIIRENQTSQEQKLVPFRESKLTQLFQHALLGKESVTMIVNVNSEKYLFEETQHVLKASAIAKHIVVQNRPMFQRQLRLTRRSSFAKFVITNKSSRSTNICWDSCVRNANGNGSNSLETIQDSVMEPSDVIQKQETYEELLVLVESLKDKLKAEKDNSLQLRKKWQKREEEIRNGMKEEWEGILAQVEEQKKVDEKRLIKTHEYITKLKNTKVEETIEGVKLKRPRMDLQRTSPDEIYNVEDLQYELRVQQGQINGLIELVDSFKDEKKELTMEVTSLKMKLSFKEKENKNLKGTLELFGKESDLKAAYLNLEKEMEERIKKRDALLEEARSDYLDELSKVDDLEEYIQKLEEDIDSKNEAIGRLQSELKDLNIEFGEGNDLKAAYLNLEKEMKHRLKNKDNLLEEVRSDYLDELSKVDDLEENIKKLMEEINFKNESIRKLQTKVEDLNKELIGETRSPDLLQANYEKLLEVAEKANTDLKKNIEELENKFAEELNIYQTEIESMSVDRITQKEKLINLQEEMDVLKKEFVAKEQYLNDKLVNSINREEAVETIRRELQDEYSEEMTKLIIKMTEENGLKSADLKKEFQLEKFELEKQVSELGKQLESERENYKLLKNELELMEAGQVQLKEQLANNNKRISELEICLERVTVLKKEVEDNHRSEVLMLQQSVKEQLEELTKQWDLLRDRDKHIEELSQELRTYKMKINSLYSTLKFKDHELESYNSKLIGYESSMPTLKTNLQCLQAEKYEYRNRCEDLSISLNNMEKEILSFQNNQKEIIGKYEEQLKKTKEENELLKKEVARVTSTFFKSNPTPKKELERQIEELKKELEDLKKQTEDLKKQLEEAKASNEKVEEGIIAETLVVPENGPSTRLRCKSTTDPQTTHLAENRSQSASKMMLRKKTRTVLAPVAAKEETVSTDNELKKTAKTSRKKLWDASAQDENNITFDEVEFERVIPQESPRSVVKRNLRTRQK